MDNCIFCKIIKGEIPSKKLYEDDKVVIIMDINPVVDGHVLVIPKEHIVDYTEMPDDLLAHISKVAKEYGKELMRKLESKGLTLTVNYGDSQVVKHYHLHLLPDYNIKEVEKTVEEVYEIIK